MTGGSGGGGGNGGATLPLFEADTLLHSLIGQAGAAGGGGRPDDMMLLEKQGRCSQAQRQQELARGGSLPPSSLPKPKRHRKSSATAKLGEYGRLSDSELSGVTPVAGGGARATRSRAESLSPAPRLLAGSRDSSPKALGEYSRLTDERKARTLTPPPSSAQKSADSGIPRRFGEYRRAPENEKLQLPADDYGRRESPRRYAQAYDYGGAKAGDGATLAGSGGGVGKAARESPGRSMFIKWGGEYNKLKIAENERKLSTNSTSSTEALIKPRGSPMRSFIPSPASRRGEYACFTPASMASPQVEHKIGPNVESKLRIFSPGGVPGRRGSLQRECKKELSEGVRSLPTPNKYRIHF